MIVTFGIAAERGDLERDVAAGLLGLAQLVEKALDRIFVDVADQRDLGPVEDRRPGAGPGLGVASGQGCLLMKAAAPGESGRQLIG